MKTKEGRRGVETTAATATMTSPATAAASRGLTTAAAAAAKAVVLFTAVLNINQVWPVD